MRLTHTGAVRRLVHKQIVFEIDGERPFLPLPHNQAFPMFEWGMNWCISTNLHKWVLIHSAVVEKNGRAVIMPAPPGSGKSTLCAALVARGWRLLSDEMALIDPSSGLLQPFPRPVSLKNQSIQIIRDFASPGVIGPVFPDTHKGDIAHLKVPTASRERALECAQPGWIIFPRYKAGATTRLSSISKAAAVMQLAGNSFNQDRLGDTAFRTLVRVAAQCGTHEFEYSMLDDAIRCFDNLANGVVNP